MATDIAPRQRKPSTPRPGDEDLLPPEAGSQETDAQLRPAPENADQAFDDVADLKLVEDADITLSLPLIERARVIYVGSNPKKSKAWRGQVVVESWEIEPAMPADLARGIAAKEAVREYSKSPNMEHGITSYDFSIRDIRGRLITARLMPADTHRRVAGKPWALVEHPEHLRLFKRQRDAEGRPEYEVMIPMARRAAFDNFVADRERMIGRHTTLADYAAGRRETPE